MENTGEKINDNNDQVVTKEIRAEIKRFDDGIGKNDLKMNKGVFGNEDKELNSDVNPGVSKITVDLIQTNPIVNVINDCCENGQKVKNDSEMKANDESIDRKTYEPTKKVESYVNMVKKGRDT
uniref:Uncharacterized protein n=1 Tax=Tanacetum cinerariifolium TaxID=118510 RepID=A0A6L2JG65_TANCI|nr:hypothetical protein [Tanacetum cinerariifolium]